MSFLNSVKNALGLGSTESSPPGMNSLNASNVNVISTNLKNNRAAQAAPALKNSMPTLSKQLGGRRRRNKKSRKTRRKTRR